MFKRFEENFDLDFIEEVLKTAVIIAAIMGIVVFVTTMIFIEVPVEAAYEEYSSFESPKYDMYDWVIQQLDAEVSEEKHIGEEEEYDTYSSESITPVAKVIGKGMIIPKRNISVVEDCYIDDPEPEIETNTIIYQQNWNTANFSDEDYYYLLCAIVGEAQCCSWEEQIYVGSVILNRVNSKWFSENTIKEVCLAKNQYACFWGENPLAYREPTETNKKAAQFLMENGSQLPENVIFQALFEQGDGVYIKMGSGTYFCYKNE